MRNKRQHIKRIQMGFLHLFGFLLLLPTLAHATPATSHPVPSEKLKEVLVRQETRVLAGEKDLAPFSADLASLSMQGDPVAEFLLGMFLLESNTDKAISLLKDSAQKGCAGSAGIVGIYLMGIDKKSAKEWLVRAAGSGNSDAQMMISTFYEKGSEGYPKSIEKAIAWAELAQWQSYRDVGIGPLYIHALELREKLSPNQIKSVEMIVSSLKKQYPKQPYYICGQTYLPPGGLGAD